MKRPEDLLNAERISITEVAKRLNVSVCTVWRWLSARAGKRRLPSLKILGRRFVVISDLQDFLNAANSESTTSPAAPSRSADRQRLKRVDAAEAALDRLGITGTPTGDKKASQ